MLQHVTNPEFCIQCSACEMACPTKAIKAIAGRYCIDEDACNECGKCIAECPTGAANAYVEVDRYFSQDEQSSWQNLSNALNE